MGAKLEPAQVLAPHLSKTQTLPTRSTPTALVAPHVLPRGAFPSSQPRDTDWVGRMQSCQTCQLASSKLQQRTKLPNIFHLFHRENRFDKGIPRTGTYHRRNKVARFRGNFLASHRIFGATTHGINALG
jgi:hypothetical protein